MCCQNPSCRKEDPACVVYREPLQPWRSAVYLNTTLPKPRLIEKIQCVHAYVKFGLCNPGGSLGKPELMTIEPMIPGSMTTESTDVLYNYLIHCSNFTLRSSVVDRIPSPSGEESLYLRRVSGFDEYDNAINLELQCKISSRDECNQLGCNPVYKHSNSNKSTQIQ